jgi:hypothetical protein
MSSKIMNPHRRQLLNMMGLTAGSLFLPSLVGDKKAYAQGPQKRLFVFYTPHGPVNQRWQMRSNGKVADYRSGAKPDASMETTFALNSVPQTNWSQILAPLYAHRAKINVLEGLAMTSALLDVSTNNHNAGTSHSLTGAKMVYPGGFKQEGGGGGSSIDQIVADKIADPNKIKSLYYNTGVWSPVFRGKSEQQGEGSVYKAYEKLFPLSQSGNAMFDYLKTRRADVFGAVKGEYEKLAPRLGGEDKAKLDNHFQLVSELQQQIKYKAEAGAKCSSRPAMNPGDQDLEPAHIKGFGQIITAAFACDMTRVATLALTTPNAKTLTDATVGLDIHVDMHQDIAHAATPANPMAYDKMSKYYAMLAGHFASILSMFDSVTVDGSKTLLDQTVCVWLCELANGPHDLHDIMAVTAGSGGGYFKTGNYIKFAENQSVPRKNNIGPAHNKLLVSIAQSMGLTQDSIGMDDAQLKGPLPNLKA